MAKTAGFCFGVKRAVEQVYEQIEKAKEPVYTYGPIIHNQQVVKDLEEKGVCVLNTDCRKSRSPGSTGHLWVGRRGDFGGFRGFPGGKTASFARRIPVFCGTDDI